MEFVIEVLFELLKRALRGSVKGVLILFAALNLAACGREFEVCKQDVPADDARPDILVIGDSISYGYTPTLRAQLPAYDVVHNPCNGKDSRNGAYSINYWLTLRPHWEVITFNHGAWDVSPRREVDGADYARFLRYEATRIKERTDKPLFVLTASVPVNDRTRSVGSEVAYNEIAKAIMNDLGIPYVDIYTLSLGIQGLRMRAAEQDDVHWTPQGSELFGLEILTQLNNIYGIH